MTVPARMYYWGGPRNPPHPGALQNANAYFSRGLNTGGRQYVMQAKHPMAMQLDQVWSGSYKSAMWDPLKPYRGATTAPPLNTLDEAVFTCRVPNHTPTGFQMVALRGDGTPIGGTPETTPQYVHASPIQIGPMSATRVIMRADQYPRPAPTIAPYFNAFARAGGSGPFGGGSKSLPVAPHATGYVLGRDQMGYPLYGYIGQGSYPVNGRPVGYPDAPRPPAPGGGWNGGALPPPQPTPSRPAPPEPQRPSTPAEPAQTIQPAEPRRPPLPNPGLGMWPPEATWPRPPAGTSYPFVTPRQRRRNLLAHALRHSTSPSSALPPAPWRNR